MYKKIISCFLIFFTINNSWSQCTINGSIEDSLNNPIPFATIALLSGDDSTIVNEGVSDENGIFSLKKVKPGNYIVRIFAIGFVQKDELITRNDTSKNSFFEKIKLKASPLSLDEISVVALRKTFEFKNGNITVNIENSPLAAGNSVYDLLLNLPGVIIDNDVISIQGRPGVKILIDDRLQQMAGGQLINLLRSISASSIEKIEIFKNPPIKYDAAGTAGIINIKTKKVKIYGFSGNVNSTVTQGDYTRSNGGFSFNYKGKKITFISNINTGYGIFANRSQFNKIVFYDSLYTELKQNTIETSLNKSLSYEIGIDYNINRKNWISVRVGEILGNQNPIRKGKNFISDNSLGFDHLIYKTSFVNKWNYFNYSINSEHLLDTVGTKLNIGFNFSKPNSDSYVGEFDNVFFDKNENEVLEPRIFKTINNLNVEILSGKIDFERKIKSKILINGGIKATSQSMKSDFILTNRNNQTGIFVEDTGFTNDYAYYEKVLAGYIRFVKEIKKINLEVALRSEYTNVNASGRTNSFIVNKQYINFFPLFSIDYAKSENHNFQFSYNRRINRPSYYSYNPYKTFDNLFSSGKGNPFITPEYSNTFELTYLYKNRISNSISFSELRNYILDYTLQNDSTKETIGYVGNLKSSLTLGYTFFYQKEIKSWWTISVNLNGSYFKYSGVINDLKYEASLLSYQGFMKNEFLLFKKVKAEINAQYFGPRLTGVFEMGSRWGVSIALKKSFIKDKLNFVIGLNDVFNTFIGRNKVNFQNQKWNIIQTNDTRRFKISLNYNFGKVKVKKKNANGIEEERGRLNH